MEASIRWNGQEGSVPEMHLKFDYTHYIMHLRTIEGIPLGSQTCLGLPYKHGSTHDLFVLIRKKPFLSSRVSLPFVVFSVRQHHSDWPRFYLDDSPPILLCRVTAVTLQSVHLWPFLTERKLRPQKSFLFLPLHFATFFQVWLQCAFMNSFSAYVPTDIYATE